MDTSKCAAGDFFVDTSSFQIEQEWECCIERISEDRATFTAALIDITANQQCPSEEADFRIDSVDESDRHLLTPGLLFRWLIGYELPLTANKQLTSKIHIIRWPALTDEAVVRVNQKALQLKEGIRWE